MNDNTPGSLRVPTNGLPVQTKGKALCIAQTNTLDFTESLWMLHPLLIKIKSMPTTEQVCTLCDYVVLQGFCNRQDYRQQCERR